MNWENILKFILEQKILIVLAIIAISVVLYKIIKKAINKFLERNKENKKLDAKGKTLFKLFSNIIKYVILIIAVALILQVYGVNVTSIVAGLGLVSVIAGLAIQDALKDIISGTNIIIDDYYALGDVIKIDNIEGKVIQLGMKSTKIKSIKNGNIYTIANRNISKVEKMSEELYLGIGLSYDNETGKIDTILSEVAEQLKEIREIKNAKYLGLSEFGDSAIQYKFQIICKPENRYKATIEFNKILKKQLDMNNIEIPYPQVTVHNS